MNERDRRLAQREIDRRNRLISAGKASLANITPLIVDRSDAHDEHKREVEQYQAQLDQQRHQTAYQQSEQLHRQQQQRPPPWSEAAERQSNERAAMVQAALERYQEEKSRRDAIYEEKRRRFQERRGSSESYGSSSGQQGHADSGPSMGNLPSARGLPPSAAPGGIMSWPSQPQAPQGYNNPFAAAMQPGPADAEHDRHLISAVDYDQPIRRGADPSPGRPRGMRGPEEGGGGGGGLGVPPAGGSWGSGPGAEQDGSQKREHRVKQQKYAEELRQQILEKMTKQAEQNLGYRDGHTSEMRYPAEARQEKDWMMGNAGPLPPPRHQAKNSLSKEDYRAALQQQMEDKRTAELYHRAMDHSPSPGRASALPGMEDDSPYYAAPPERGQAPGSGYPAPPMPSAVGGPRRQQHPSMSKEEYKHALEEQMAQQKQRQGGRQQQQPSSYPYGPETDGGVVPPGGGSLPLKEGRHPNKLSQEEYREALERQIEERRAGPGRRGWLGQEDEGYPGMAPLESPTLPGGGPSGPRKGGLSKEAYRAELERQMAERKEREMAARERDRAEAAAIKVSLPSGDGLGRPSPPRMFGRPSAAAPVPAFFPPPQPAPPMMPGYGSGGPPKQQRGMPAGPAAAGPMAPSGPAAPQDDGVDAERAREEREKKQAYARELMQQMEEAKARKEREKMESKMPAATSGLGAVGSPPPGGRRHSIPVLPVPGHDPNMMNALPLAAQGYYGPGQSYPYFGQSSPVTGQYPPEAFPGGVPLHQASPEGYPPMGSGNAGGAFFGGARQGAQPYMMDSAGGPGRGFGAQQAPAALSQLDLAPSPTTMANGGGAGPYGFGSPVQQQQRGPGGYPREDLFGATGGSAFGATGGSGGVGGAGMMYGGAGLSPTWSSADQSMPFPSMLGGQQPHHMQQQQPPQQPGGKAPRGRALKEIQGFDDPNEAERKIKMAQHAQLLAMQVEDNAKRKAAEKAAAAEQERRETEKIERERQEMEVLYKAEQEKKRHEEEMKSQLQKQIEDKKKQQKDEKLKQLDEERRDLERVAREQEQLRRMYEAEQSKSGGRKPGRTEDDVAAAAAGQMTPSRGPVLGGRHQRHRSRSDGAQSVDDAWDAAQALAADRPIRGGDVGSPVPVNGPIRQVVPPLFDPFEQPLPGHGPLPGGQGAAQPGGGFEAQAGAGYGAGFGAQPGVGYGAQAGGQGHPKPGGVRGSRDGWDFSDNRETPRGGRDRGNDQQLKALELEMRRYREAIESLKQETSKARDDAMMARVEHRRVQGEVERLKQRMSMEGQQGDGRGLPRILEEGVELLDMWRVPGPEDELNEGLGRRPESLDYLRRAANDLERVLQYSARDGGGGGGGGGSRDVQFDYNGLDLSSMQAPSSSYQPGAGDEGGAGASSGGNNLFGLNKLGFDETIRPTKVAWGGKNPFGGPRFDEHEKENMSRAANHHHSSSSSSSYHLPTVSVSESLRADSHFVFPDGRKLGALSMDPFIGDPHDAVDVGGQAMMVNEAMAMAAADEEGMAMGLVVPCAPEPADPCHDPCAGVVSCCCECCCQEVCCCDEGGDGGGGRVVEASLDGDAFDLDKVLERTRDRARRLELLGSDGEAGDDVYKFLLRNRKYGDGYCPPSEDARGVAVESEQVEVAEDGMLVRRGKKEVDHNLHGSVRWVTRDGGVA